MFDYDQSKYSNRSVDERVWFGVNDMRLLQTYVYGDLYRYDVDKNEWKLISSPNSPPPRSAHQAVAWKNYLYIYGK